MLQMWQKAVSDSARNKKKNNKTVITAAHK